MLQQRIKLVRPSSNRTVVTWTCFYAVMLLVGSVVLGAASAAAMPAGAGLMQQAIQPQVPEEICGDCIIYGVPIPTAAIPAGIYQIDVCTGVVRFVQALPNALNLAVADSTHLYVGDTLDNLFKDDLTTLAPPPGVGMTSGGAVGMSEGGNGTLFDVEGGFAANGALHSLIPQPPVLQGYGMVGGANVRYPGDLVLSPSCKLLSATLTDWVRVIRSNGQVIPQAPLGNAYIGLAYDGAGRLWAEFYPGVHRISEATGAPVGGVVPTAFNGQFVQWIDLASNPCNSCTEDNDLGDLGDAPDSTSHFVATQMTAYTGVTGTFPSVFDAVTGLPQGMRHWIPREDAFFGAAVSGERDADLLPDGDTIINIDPAADSANRDGFDDGLQSPLSLPHCQSTQITATITVNRPQTVRYLNVWFDFNRDGDWADTLTCINGQGSQVTVPEWAVQDQVTNLTPGVHVVISNSFTVYDPNYPAESTWMRMSLSESQAIGTDGRGPSSGYEFGETEDYLLKPKEVGALYTAE